jgi:uncharacterized protein (TIGR02246 family)
MRRSRALWIGVLLLAALVAGCTGGQKKAPVVDTAAISAAVDSVSQAFNAAVAARDTTAVADLYADDAHMLPASAPRADGKEALHKQWAVFLATPGLQLTSVSNQKIVSEAGDLVVDLGTYDFKATGPKHKPLHDVGKYVTVFKKVDGKWRLAVDTWNSDLPTPGQSK